MLGAVADRLRRWERLTRPVDPETRAVYARRWAELPERSRNPGQTIGRHAVGCEGTHGVFPRCNFSCQPCYHSADANHVRVDGPHTIARIREQMGLLRQARGPHGHAQLIGGEVSLLEPHDHAEALAVMRSFGRNPMSMTHGDFDYDYLRRVCVDGDGRPRFGYVSFAGHFDTTMIGRTGARRPVDEAELHGHRQAFCDMFARLYEEYGIRFYLAHNMTVTPANVEQIPEVIEACRHMGFKMFSFQPAAHVGNSVRWKDDYRSLEAEAVWALIEKGAGSRLPWEVLQVGDTRCNRTAWGFYVGNRWHSLLDDTNPRDLAARDRFFRHLGGVHFNAPPRLLAARLARVAASHPSTLATGLGWLARAIRRAGPVELFHHRPEPMTFVMHRFMHADDVAPAWELMQRGETATDEKILETQERLAACSYVMAHPESGQLVPACVQHSLLDPEENRQLAQLLPLPSRRRGTADPRPAPIR
ncbi:MAG: radical SAM domain-containing protein [Acidobacteriota bacterium]|nr:radical SAM domain-containing protein [Acidobacteriota bacterium]